MKNILITGADGYLGSRFVAESLKEGNSTIHLWMRANDRAEFLNKKSRLLNQLGEDGRLNFYYGDLVAENPFETVKLVKIDKVIHFAAVTDFNVTKDRALNVNLEGTRKLLKFIRRYPGLSEFSLISSVYACGLKKGFILEQVLGEDEGFSNYYEWSKWASENLLINEYSDLPWKIIRVATAICDSGDGAVRQQNAFHNTLKLFYYGLLSLMPGDPTTTLYFVTGKESAEMIRSISEKGAAQKIYHVAHRKEESLSLGELVDIAFDVFAQDKDFKIRRIIKPLFTDLEAFNLLERGMQSFSSGIVNQAVSSVSPFARQLFYEKEFENKNTIAILTNYRSVNFREIVRRTCEYLVKTKWNKLPVPHV